ncbi:MAG: membrane protein insertase YidC [Bauldia sp.]
MGNNRNFIIAIALSVLVLVVWQVFVANPQVESARQAAEEAAATQAAQTETVTPAAPVGAEPAVVAAATPAVCAVTQVTTREEALVQNPRIAIETPALTGSINLCGARIDDLRLNHYQETVDPDSPTIVLLSPAQGPLGYYAELGWRRSGAALVDAGTLWTAPEGAVLTQDAPVVLTYDNGAGLVFTRTVAVDEEYMFTVTDAVTNSTGGDVALTPYGRITRADQNLSTGFFILHEGMIGFLGDDGLQQVDYSALTDGPRQYDSATTGWLGITDKYWAATLIPEQGQPFIGRFAGSQDQRHFEADYTGAPRPIANGTTATVTANLFAGAKEVAIVDGYEAALDIPRFELLIDWGWFYFITKPMFSVLDWLYRLVGNFGVAILLVTVILKLIFFPLANRSYRSMAAMRKFTPQIAALRERHKDDRAKQQQAMLELYRKEKINPVAGCWPILIQIPVFFALYKVLFVTLEMRHQPFFGWIQDLSAPDPTSIFNLFGLLPFEPPAFLGVGIWPVIMGITMWAQFQLNPQTPGTPKWIFNILPLVFTFMLASFPAGLVIYWAWNNLLSVIQQSVIMKRNGVDVNLFANIRSTFRRKPKDAKAKT